MDPITHGALGATISQITCGKRLQKKAWLIGALAAMAPDLDIFIRSAHNPLLSIQYHRGFSHSLVFIPVAALIMTLFWCLIRKKWLPLWPWIFLASACAVFTHGLLDCLTAYGTQWFWPFTHARIAFDRISIIDPVVTFPLLVGAILSRMYLRKLPASIALAVVILYLLFGSWQHHRALKLQQHLIDVRHANQAVTQRRVLPTFANLMWWTSIYRQGTYVYIDKIMVPLWGNNKVKWGVRLKRFTAEQLPNFIKHSPSLYHDYKVFDWFTDAYTVLGKRQPLVLCDGRYLRQLEPPVCLWAVEFLPQHKHVRWLRNFNIPTTTKQKS